MTQIHDLAWMTGHWAGQMGDDPIEEHWSAASGDSIMGMFKYVHDDTVQMYEFMLIVLEDDQLVLKIRHYDADFTGWENKDQMVRLPTTAVGERSVTFKRDNDPENRQIMYVREDDTLTATMTTVRDDKTQVDEFVYTLQTSP